MSLPDRIRPPPLLPDIFTRWFARRGWTPRAHQLQLLEKAEAERSTLLIAPTGGGKTLAGFLPTLVELHQAAMRADSLPRLRGRVGEGASSGGLQLPPPGELRTPTSPASGRGRKADLHTLYISPLKALAVDITRNLETPVAEMGLPIRIEARTGDTPVSKRTRQRRDPPDILMTTPEQLALLLASADAPYLFGTLKRVVLDELHALVTSKRGDLLALDLARLHALAPGLQTVGLSATVADPDALRRYLVPQRHADPAMADLIVAEAGAEPDVSMLPPGEDLPWAGHTARHAYPAIYELIKRHKTTLVFVNTRSQAEMIFHELWNLNDDGLAIALHHGSLDVAQRRKVEAAMAA
ncbi:MAG: DEAD/DEAH box helicase, partial [Pseudorhodoplanes sp.]